MILLPGAKFPIITSIMVIMIMVPIITLFKVMFPIITFIKVMFPNITLFWFMYCQDRNGVS